jgi:broad specificity phosphatase PhoE
MPTQSDVWPTTLKRWLAGDTGYAPVGAESYDDLRVRLLPVWDRLTTELDGQVVVIVAHGIVCRVLLLERLLGHALADWTRLGPIANVAIHELLREGAQSAWQAVRLNDRPVK